MDKFSERVLILTTEIPWGKVTSYGELARAIGGIKYSRAIGNALNRNSCPVGIPCHRVVKSDGSLGGYSQGVDEKIRLLHKEGVQVKDEKILDFESVFFRFSY